MIAHDYLAKARAVLDHLEATQLPQVEAAAQLVVQAMRSGGVVYSSEVGHGIQWDYINRAGGLVAVQPYDFAIRHTAARPACSGPDPAAVPDADLLDVRHAVLHGPIRAGDVLLIASVSGKNRRPVEMALACRAKGVHTIGFTSLTYTAKVDSLHPSGKRLSEACDVVIDNGAPYGDAGLQIPGYAIPLVPMSGIGMVAAGWLIWSRVMELMAATGEPASVLLSQNRDGGPEHNDAARARYHQKGY